MGLEGRGGEGGGKEKKEEGKKHSRLNQKERRLTNAGYDTFKSTEALRRLIPYAKIIYGVKICVGTTEEGREREKQRKIQTGGGEEIPVECEGED